VAAGRDLARAILAREPKAIAEFERLYGRQIEKAITGVQDDDGGPLYSFPLFCARVAEVVSPLVLAGGADGAGDPFPPAIASLALGDLYLASAASRGSAGARARAAARLVAAGVEPMTDFAAYDGRRPLSVPAPASPSAESPVPRFRRATLVAALLVAVAASAWLIRQWLFD